MARPPVYTEVLTLRLTLDQRARLLAVAGDKTEAEAIREAIEQYVRSKEEGNA